ncbi:hypothetical protein QTP70_008500 [Hemibagrus guttatus]|uniref:Integrase catalytic domain-containing protein n=1 Tax=Hemibagrus guttatus TaxID=175788 RepID=A0AAE0R1I8_9TELE|nr:hypothetical protein QTP70_008500 [Hemibagrus guttatus]
MGGASMTQTLVKEFGSWDMECHLTGGEEPEIVREVEWYWLEIVGLVSMHSLGSGTQLLERGWALFYSGVPHGMHRPQSPITGVQVLFDSGSYGNFISSHLLSACKVPCQRNPTHYQITTIQGKPLDKGLVQWKMPELTLRIGCLHEEMLSLLVLKESAVDVVLGCPWLAKHQPNIRWNSGSIDQWSDYCIQHCLRSLPMHPPETAVLGSTTIESPVSCTQLNLPGEYQDYQDVFSQMAATKLPPHRPWDCAIDLLPGAKLPKGRVYPLSIPENKAMEEYISEALQQGFIRPSTPPAASSFFFVAKKDGGLRPCIDYHVLNSQTVKFAYPLPLVPVALEELRGAHIFSKLDLCSAYNLIHIRRGDEWKTAFISPSDHVDPDLFVCPITWSLDDDICAATEEEPAPPGGPDDHFSKACKLIPLKGLPTALETAEALFTNFFRHFGIPEDIMSDRGSQFISRVWRGFFKLLGVSVSLSSGYHPQTNGQTERKIQEIGRYLRAYCHGHQHDWSQYLPWAKYAQNSLRQESTKLPFQCILGYQPPLFPWSAEPSEVPTVDHWF